MYKVEADGTKHFRKLHDVFIDLMITSHTTSRNMEKDLLAISGGRRKLAAQRGNTLLVCLNNG